MRATRLPSLLLTGLCLLAAPTGTAQSSPFADGSIRAVGGQGFVLESVEQVAAGPGTMTVVSGSVFAGDSGSEVYQNTDGAWSRLDGVFDGDINALAVSSGGVAHAAGSFQSVDGREVSLVAFWDGTEWQHMGNGLEGGTVLALRHSPAGVLHAVVRYPQTPGYGTQRIVRWTGSEWLDVGEEYDLVFECTAFGPCDALGFGPDGTLYAGVPGISRWNGTSWIPVGTVPLIGAGDIIIQDGMVHAFGRFQEWNGRSLNGAARFTGSTWERMDFGLEGGVYAATVDADGAIWAAGIMGWDRTLARWNGTAWQQMAAGNLLRDVAARPTGGVVAVGFDGDTSTNRYSDVVRNHTLTTTTDLFESLDGIIDDLAIPADGSFILGGERLLSPTVLQPGLSIERAGMLAVDNDGTIYRAAFYSQQSTQRSYAISEKSAGGSYTEIGGSIIDSGRFAYTDLLVAADGALLVTGWFNNVYTASGRGVARWDGSTWSLLGGPMEDYTQGVAQASDGTVYALASHGLRRYNGSGWDALGQTDGTTSDVHVGTDGAVYIAGAFSSVDGVPATDVARWQNGAWTALGDGPGWTVREIRTDAQGAPTACGAGVARWNGDVWIQEVEIAANRTVFACEFTADGDLVFAGDFAEPNGVNAPYIAVLESPGFVAGDPTPDSDGLTLTLAPNPSSGSASGLLTGLIEPGTMTLFDALGRRIAQVEVGAAIGRTSIALPTAGLSPGVYVVRLTSGETVESRRLVITR